MKTRPLSRISGLSFVCLSALSIGCGPEASVPPPVVPTASPEPAPPGPSASELHEQAEKIRARVIAVQKQMNATIKAHEGTEAQLKDWAKCMATTCRDAFKASMSPSALLIHAMTPLLPLTDRSKPLDDKETIALESKVSEAERFASQADEKAKEEEKDNAAHEASDIGKAQRAAGAAWEASKKRRDEKAEPACKKSVASCKAACEGKEDFANEACVVYAEHLVKQPNTDLKKVKDLLKKPCEAETNDSCQLIAQLDKGLSLQSKKQGQAFEMVMSEGDDLAAKTYMVKAVESLGGKKRLMAAKAMKAQMAASVRESFCPAKKEAIASLGQKEFASRVAKHCEEDPPMTQGLSGKQIELKAECKATFSTACP